MGIPDPDLGIAGISRRKFGAYFGAHHWQPISQMRLGIQPSDVYLRAPIDEYLRALFNHGGASRGCVRGRSIQVAGDQVGLLSEPLTGTLGMRR